MMMYLLSVLRLISCSNSISLTKRWPTNNQTGKDKIGLIQPISFISDTTSDLELENNCCEDVMKYYFATFKPSVFLRMLQIYGKIVGRLTKLK